MTPEQVAAASGLGVMLIAPLPGGLAGGAWLGDRAGRTVVIKPDPPSSGCAEAFGLWAGQGAARLLDCAPGVLILEHLQPGDPLAAVTDGEYAAAAVALTAQLWRPCRTLPGLDSLCADWTSGLHGSGWERELSEARALATDLLGSAPVDVLLHGDLHPGNILRCGEGWKAVDPQPRSGDPAFDVEPLLRRFLDGGDLGQAAAFADRLGVSPQRSFAWALVRSAWYGAASQLAGDAARVRRWRARRALLRTHLHDYGHGTAQRLRTGSLTTRGWDVR